MKQKLLLLIALSLITGYSYGQVIDRYGFSIGASYATQLWNYKLASFDSDINYKSGLMSFVAAEKDLSDILCLRTELGYVQKGFNSKFDLIFGDGLVEKIDDNVILHDLALNLGMKASPFKFGYAPYFFIGCRFDYMISYKDIVFKEQVSGLKFNMYESQIKDFNKFNLGGLLALGFDIKELLYLEIEYNPCFTKSFDDKGLSIKDICWGIKLGVNINKLIDE